jgi:hypothetical protein
MAVQTATNPDTGERVALVDGEWKPVVKTATNPDTGARAFLVGDQWLVNETTAKVAPTKETAVPKVSRETVAEERPDLGSPMGESFISEVANVGTPKKQSVLEGKQLPATKETQDKYVLDPKFVTGLEAQLNALPEEERQAKLDKLATRPDVYGRAAKLIQQRYENYNAITQPTISKSFDPRLEAQTERFIQQASLETAQGEAARQARRGQIGRNLAEVTETPKEVQEGMEYKLPADATPIEQTLNTLQRGVKLGALGAETAVRGTHRFIGDMLGMNLPGFDTQKNFDKINAVTQGMGQNTSKPLQIVEGAISSISQQLPYMIAGLATGSEAAVLVPMFANAFGQNYDEARRAGLNAEDSTVRSTLNSIFEVLGEKAGLGSQMKALKASTKGIPTSDLVAYYTKALAKEVPGEELTYAGQSAVDKVLGLNPDMDFKGFLKGAAETMLATVTQGGMMMAGGAGINKAVRTLAGPQQIQQEQQQEVPPPPPPPANQTVPIAPGITPAKAQPAAGQATLPVVNKEEQVQKLAESYMASGIPEEDALKQAKNEVYGELGIEPEKKGPIADNKLKTWPQAMLESTLDFQNKKPKEKQNTALIEQIEAEISRRQGEQNAGQVVPPTGGVSTGVPSGAPAVNAAPAGAGTLAGNGVVSTKPNAGIPNAGEATQPAPVKEKQPIVDEKGAFIPSGEKGGSPIASAGFKTLDENNNLSDDLVGATMITGMDVTNRNKGAGTKLLNAITNWADTNGRTLALVPAATPDGALGGLNQEQLKDWYARNGFENHGDYMVRNPQTETKGAEVGTETTEAEQATQPAPVEEPTLIEPTLDQDIATQKKLLGALDRARNKLLKDENLASGDPRIDAAKAAVEKAQNEYDTYVTESEPRRTKRIEELTKGAEVGTETTEAEQATQEEPKKPAGAKRGPKGARLTPEEKAAKTAAGAPARAANTAADIARNKYAIQLEEAAKPIDPDTEVDQVESAEQDKKDLRRTALEGLLKAYARVGNTPAGKRIKELLAKHATPQQLEDVKKGMAEREKRLASYTKENVLPGGLEDRPYTASPSIVRRYNVAPVNRGFNKATNAAQALQQVLKTGNFFQKLLAKRLRGFVNGVSFEVIEKGQPLPDVLQRNMDTWGRASAIYIRDESTGKRSVYVRGESFGPYHGVNNVDVLHELLHAATNQRIYLGLYSSAKNIELGADVTRFVRELTSIMIRAEQQYNKMKQQGLLSQEIIDRVESTRDENGDLAIFEQPEEFLAYGMSNEDMQDFLMSIKGTQKDETAFSKFVRSIMKLFGIGDGYYNAFSDLVNTTDQILNAQKTDQMRAIERGEMRSAQMAKEKRERVSATLSQKEMDKVTEDNAIVKQNLDAIAKSTDPTVVGENITTLQLLRNPSKLLGAAKRAVNELTYAEKSFLLNIPTTDAVAALSGIESLTRAHQEMERMAGMEKQMLDAASKLVDTIEKRFDESDDPNLRKKVDIFTYATQGINPETNKNVPEINKMYAALGPVGQSIFKDVTKYYEHMFKYTGTLLKQVVAEASQGTSQGPAIIKQLSDLLASENRIESYVPLLRDQGGHFFLRDKASGAFFIRDSLAAREALVANIAKKTGKTRKQLIEDEDITVGNNVADLRTAALSSSALLKQIVTMVETAPTSPQLGSDELSRQDTTDAIVQLWLQLQPEQSMRKGFIHRKTTPGYDVDVTRGLVRSAVKFSKQIPKLKYGRMIRNSISSAKSSIAQTDNMTPYVLEMEKRADSVLNPPPKDQGRIVAALRFANSMAYTYYLSQATAIANTISAYEIGVPQLLKKHSALEVTTEMGKLMNVWSSLTKYDSNGKLIMPTVTNSSAVTENDSDTAEQKQRKSEDRRAINAMKALNVNESTAARAMYGKMEIPSEHYGSKTEKAKYIAKQVATLAVGELIHATERISREIVYLASFRLNRNKALEKFRKTKAYQAAPDKLVAEKIFMDENFDALTMAAKKDVDQSLFNYSSANRPPWLKSDVGQFLFQFAMWRLSAAQFMARNFIGMVKPMDGDTRMECARAFFAVMGTSWSVAGTVGMPLLGAMFTFMSALYDRERDKLPADMRQLDPKTWYKTTWLKEQLGDITIGNKTLDTIIRQGPLNALTGWDVGSHVSMSDLFFNTELKETNSKSTRTEVANYVMSLAPPSISMGVNMIDGLSMMAHGEARKGFEKVVPSAAWRNLFTAGRYATEGETGRDHDKILNAKAMRISELVGQAIGLRPVIIKDIKDATQAEYKLSQKVEGEQHRILDDMFTAYINRDIPEYKRLHSEVDKFNKKYSETYPEYEITDELKNKSFDAKEEARAQSWRGSRITEKNVVPAYRLLSPSRKAAAQREQEAQ